MVSTDIDIILAPLLIVVADIIIYVLVGRLGKRSSGKGVKYEPFTGGEEDIPKRGLYQSELFVFAALFMVVEALPFFSQVLLLHLQIITRFSFS